MYIIQNVYNSKWPITIYVGLIIQMTVSLSCARLGFNNILPF